MNNNNAFNNFTNQNYSELSNYLDNLNPYEFALVGVVAAFLIAPALTTNEQNSVGNFLEEVGQVLLTIGAQAQNVAGANQNNNNQNNSNNINSKIKDLEKEIEKLKDIINKNT